MDDNNSHLHVHDAQSSVAFSFISLQSARHQTFLDERVEEGGRKGIEATVSSDSLNFVINMSINHSRLGGGREDEDFGGHHYLEGGGQWRWTVEGGGGSGYTIDRK